MFSIHSFLAPAAATFPAWLLLLSLLGISLALIFAGKTLVKVLAFLLVGIAGAAFGGALAAQYLPHGGAVLGLVLGFVVGGLLGVALVSVAIGLAVGYAAYLLALDLSLGLMVAVVFGLLFFVAGVALSDRILVLATAIAGGLLLFNVLVAYGLGQATSIVLAGFMTLLGLWVQYEPRRRATVST